MAAMLPEFSTGFNDGTIPGWTWHAIVIGGQGARISEVVRAGLSTPGSPIPCLGTRSGGEMVGAQQNMVLSRSAWWLAEISSSQRWDPRINMSHLKREPVTV